jgi:hypothetical protein
MMIGISEQIGSSAKMLSPDRIAETASEQLMGDDAEAVCPHSTKTN